MTQPVRCIAEDRKLEIVEEIDVPANQIKWHETKKEYGPNQQFVIKADGRWTVGGSVGGGKDCGPTGFQGTQAPRDYPYPGEPYGRLIIRNASGANGKSIPYKDGGTNFDTGANKNHMGFNINDNNAEGNFGTMHIRIYLVK